MLLSKGQAGEKLTNVFYSVPGHAKCLFNSPYGLMREALWSPLRMYRWRWGKSQQSSKSCEKQARTPLVEVNSFLPSTGLCLPGGAAGLFSPFQVSLHSVGLWIGLDIWGCKQGITDGWEGRGLNFNLQSFLAYFYIHFLISFQNPSEEVQDGETEAPGNLGTSSW